MSGRLQEKPRLHAPPRKLPSRVGRAARSAAKVAPAPWLRALPSRGVSLPCNLLGLGLQTPFSFNGSKTVATGGLFAGYRIQFGSMVFGAETDINAKSGSSSYALSDSNFYRTESFYGTAKQGWDGSVRARAGFLVTPWTLVYGTGGVAYGNVSGSFSYSAHEIDTCSPCASSVGSGSWSTTRVGATGGAGIETLITQALTLRLEYRYTDLGRFSENVALRTCAGTCSSPQQCGDQPASDQSSGQGRGRLQLLGNGVAALLHLT